MADDTHCDPWRGGSIRKVDVSTATVTTIVDGEDGEQSEDGLMTAFKRPSGIVCNATTLFVSDSESEQIKRVDLGTGVVTIFAGSGWDLPGGMCITKDAHW